MMTYKVTANDTKTIRNLLKENNLNVKKTQLGSNRFYILVHTSNNRKAIQILSENGYELDQIYRTENDMIFQNDLMKIYKAKKS